MTFKLPAMDSQFSSAPPRYRGVGAPSGRSTPGTIAVGHSGRLGIDASGGIGSVSVRDGKSQPPKIDIQDVVKPFDPFAGLGDLIGRLDDFKHGHATGMLQYVRALMAIAEKYGAFVAMLLGMGNPHATRLAEELMRRADEREAFFDTGPGPMEDQWNRAFGEPSLDRVLDRLGWAMHDADSETADNRSDDWHRQQAKNHDRESELMWMCSEFIDNSPAQTEAFQTKSQKEAVAAAWHRAQIKDPQGDTKIPNPMDDGGGELTPERA